MVEMPDWLRRSRVVLSLRRDGAPDDDALHVAGAFVNLAHLDVAPIALDREVAEIANPREYSGIKFQL